MLGLNYYGEWKMSLSPGFLSDLIPHWSLLEPTNNCHQLPGLSAVKRLDELVYGELQCANAMEVRGNIVHKVPIHSSQVSR